MTPGPTTTPPSDLDTVHDAVQYLLTRLNALNLATLDGALAAGLRDLEQACRAVQGLRGGDLPPPSPLVDTATFDGLLTMAGPEIVSDLLDRLVEDLGEVHRLLRAAATPPNWHILRGQSHILIGLAGTVGANRLADTAQQLNDLANNPREGEVAPLMAQISQQLTGLIHFVQARRQNMPAPA